MARSVGHGRWFTLAVLVLSAGGLGACSHQSEPLSDPLATAAAAAILPQVEAGMGEWWGEPGTEQRCVVTPFGVEPAGAATLAEVTVVYADASCATWKPGISFDDAGGSAAPVAVHLDTGQFDHPGDGPAYSAEIRRIFPERLQDRAFDIGSERAGEEAALRRRFAAVTPSAPTTPAPSPS